jgi:hypothetical protein
LKREFKEDKKILFEPELVEVGEAISIRKVPV